MPLFLNADQEEKKGSGGGEEIRRRRGDQEEKRRLRGGRRGQEETATPGEPRDRERRGRRSQSRGICIPHRLICIAKEGIFS
jgi:hypothetical protein